MLVIQFEYLDANMPRTYNIEENASKMTRDSEANSSQEQDIVRPLKSWKGYIWDTWELPSDQRWLLFKLDAFVLTFASVCQHLTLPQGCNYIWLTTTDWLFSQKPGPSKCHKCVPEWHGGGSGDVWQPTGDKYLYFHSRLCYWSDPGELNVDSHFASMGDSLGK